MNSDIRKKTATRVAAHEPRITDREKTQWPNEPKLAQRHVSHMEDAQNLESPSDWGAAERSQACGLGALFAGGLHKDDGGGINYPLCV